MISSPRTTPRCGAPNKFRVWWRAMPTNIADRKLSDLFKTVQTSHGTIDDAKALEMLAEVGDGHGYDGTKALAKLKGFSRESQIDFIKKGMSASEKKDLTAILD